MNPLRVEPKTLEGAKSGIASVPTTPHQPTAQQSLFGAPDVVPPDVSDQAAPQMVMRGTDTLKPHPSLLKQNLWPTNERLLKLAKYGNALFEQLLLITNEGLIVDGHARWLIARRQQRATMLCQMCQLTEQEALQRILQTQRRPEWLNPFSRVRLALDLEPWFREKARANQSAGGKEKLSSKLTEDRRLDCRKQIAEAAGVSSGNVTKVKQILGSPVSTQVMEALRIGEISIHRAWRLSKLSLREQETELRSRRFKKHVAIQIRSLPSKHIPKSDPVADSLRHLYLGLTGLKNTPWMSSHWKPIDGLLTALEHDHPNIRSIPDADPTKPQTNPGRQSQPLGPCADTACGPRKLPESARLQDARTRR
jgi:hypothetical protein